MNLFKKTLTFSLYKNNQAKFYRWMWGKREQILNSMWTYIIGLFGTIAIVLFAASTVYNSQEISTNDYNRLVRYGSLNSEKIPEYRTMLKDSMEDGVITYGELGKINSLKRAYWKEEEKKEHIQARKDLAKKLK